MKWEKYVGRIETSYGNAQVELIEADGEPEWYCSFQKKYDSFEAGKLEQAYEWCKKQITDHERRKKESESRGSSECPDAKSEDGHGDEREECGTVEQREGGIDPQTRSHQGNNSELTRTG